MFRLDHWELSSARGAVAQVTELLPSDLQTGWAGWVPTGFVLWETCVNPVSSQVWLPQESGRPQTCKQMCTLNDSWVLPCHTPQAKEKTYVKNVKLLMQIRTIFRCSREDREGSTATAQLQSGLHTEGGSMLFFPHAQKVGSCTTTRHLHNP